MNTEWKPIASAPKDGTRIAIKFANGNEHQANWRTTYGGEWHVDSFKYLPWADQHEITHWMPLAAAPCPTCNDQGAVGNILNAEPCPDYSPAPTSHPIPTGATGEDEEAHDEPATPADAVYGLMAWLSGRDEVVTLSARHGAAIAADLAHAFCNANGLHQFSQGYPDNLKYPTTGVARPDISDAHPSPVSEADGAKVPAIPLAWQTAAKKAIKFANSSESRTHATTAVEHIHALTDLILSAPAAGDAQMLEFVREVAQQKPEKPDHWSSCGQCERNTSTAEELLDAHAAIAQQSQRKEA